MGPKKGNIWRPYYPWQFDMIFKRSWQCWRRCHRIMRTRGPIYDTPLRISSSSIVHHRTEVVKPIFACLKIGTIHVLDLFTFHYFWLHGEWRRHCMCCYEASPWLKRVHKRSYYTQTCWGIGQRGHACIERKLKSNRRGRSAGKRKSQSTMVSSILRKRMANNYNLDVWFFDQDDQEKRDGGLIN